MQLEKVIDLHTHLFNVRYIPLAAFFESRGAPRWLAKLGKRFFHFLTGKPDLERLLARKDTEEAVVEFAASAFILEIDSIVAGHQSAGTTYSDAERISFALDSVREAEAYRLLRDIDRELGEEFASTSKFDDAMRELIAERFSLGPFKTVENTKSIGFIGRLVLRLIKKLFRGIETGLDYLSFFFTLVSTERGLWHSLSSAYSPERNVNLFVHYMMDMDGSFSGESYFAFYDDQLKRLTQIEQSAGGTVIGFSAFDPFRAVANGIDTTEKMDQFLGRSIAYGKVGFKFYPPLGYLPSGNKNPKFNYVNDLFFSWCQRNAVPVMAHCTPEGFELEKGKSGVNSHPKNWEDVLSRYPELTLCYGHAGGGVREVPEKDSKKRRTVYGWMAPPPGELPADDRYWNDDDNYARWVVEHCCKYKNVYCDLSIIHEIIFDDKVPGADLRARDILRIRLADALSPELANPYQFKDKLIYGSDWPMPQMVNDADPYLEAVNEIVSDPKVPIEPAKFYVNNALDFLMLERRRDSLVKTFGKDHADAVAKAAERV